MEGKIFVRNFRLFLKTFNLYQTRMQEFENNMKYNQILTKNTNNQLLIIVKRQDFNRFRRAEIARRLWLLR